MLPEVLNEYVGKKLAKALETTKQFAFDLETRAAAGRPAKDALDARTAIPELLVIASGTASTAFDFTDLRTGRLIQHLLTDPEMEAIVHNALYDLVVLHHNNIVLCGDIKAKLRDSMILQFLINEGESKGLKDMALRHLRHRMRTYEETTTGNPLNVEKQELLVQEAAWLKSIDMFSRARPHPEFDSPTKVTRVEYAGIVNAEAMSQPSNQGSLFSAYGDTAVAPPLSKETIAKKLEEFFGDRTRAKYVDYVNNTKISKIRERVSELDSKLREEMITYAEDDGRQTLRLWNKLIKVIDSLKLLQWLYLECEVRLITVRMSVSGIPMDIGVLENLSKVIEPLIEEFNRELQNIVKQVNDDGSPFNPDSPKQLMKAIFGILRCPIPVSEIKPDGRHLPKLTPAGVTFMTEHGLPIDLRNPDTITDEIREKYLACDAEVLERLDHPIGMHILNYRALTKLKGTYVDASIERIKNVTEHRLLGYFNSLGTTTGRLSSSDPNLQNIPSRKKSDSYDDRIQNLGPELRQAFTCSVGKSLIIVDQSQIELRVIAHFCNETTLMGVYQEGVECQGLFFPTGDVHTKTAGSLGISRKSAKPINFGFNYGMRALKFARQVRLIKPDGGYDVEKANEWRTGFLNTYAGIPSYSEYLDGEWERGVHDFKMLSGRKRHFTDLRTAGSKILNAKVQGSSADLLKISMYIIDKYVRPRCPSLELLFQVHDELGYQCNSGEEAELAGTLIKYVLEHPWFQLKVPVLSSAKICQTWAAKDDDRISEIGSYYARIKGVGNMIFTKHNWSDFLTYDKQKLVELKSSTAILSHEQRRLCESIIPQSLPPLC